MICCDESKTRINFCPIKLCKRYKLYEATPIIVRDLYDNSLPTKSILIEQINNIEIIAAPIKVAAASNDIYGFAEIAKIYKVKENGSPPN